MKEILLHIKYLLDTKCLYNNWVTVLYYPIKSDVQFQTISIQRYYPHEGLEFSGGGGRFYKTKKISQMYKPWLEFSEWCGLPNRTSPLYGRYRYFQELHIQTSWNCAAAYLAASAFCKPQQFCSLLVNQGSNCTYTEQCAFWLHLVSSLHRTSQVRK